MAVRARGVSAAALTDDGCRLSRARNGIATPTARARRAHSPGGRTWRDLLSGVSACMEVMERTKGSEEK
eukprot:2140095-Prymnesium_polylepis.1